MLSETPEAPENAPVSASSPSEGTEALKDADAPVNGTGGEIDNAFRAQLETRISQAESLGLTVTPEMIEQFVTAISNGPADLSDAINEAHENFNPSKKVHKASSRFPCDHEPAVTWLVEGVLQTGQITLLTSKGGTGKGHWRVALALDLANGCSSIGYKIPKQMKTLVVMLEDEWQTDSDRMHTNQAARSPENYQAKFQYDPATNREAIAEVMDRVDVYAASVDPMDFFQRVEGNRVTFTSRVNEFIQFIKDNEYDVVIFDPIINLTDGLVSENDNGEMGVVMRTIKRITEEAKVATIIVTHVSRGFSREDVAEPRGAGSQYDLARIALALSHLTDSDLKFLGLTREEATEQRLRRITLTKANHADDTKDVIYLKIELREMQFKDGTKLMPRMVQHKPVDPMIGVNDWAKDRMDDALIEGFAPVSESKDEMPLQFYKPRPTSGKCAGNLALLAVQRVLPDKSDAAAQNIVEALLRGGNAEQPRWVLGDVPQSSFGNRSKTTLGVMPRTFFDQTGGLPPNDRFTRADLEAAFKYHNPARNGREEQG